MLRPVFDLRLLAPRISQARYEDEALISSGILSPSQTSNKSYYAFKWLL